MAADNPEGPLDASVQLLKSNTDYKKPIIRMEVKEIGAKQFILVVLCDGVVSVHYISQVWKKWHHEKSPYNESHKDKSPTVRKS